jgi:hypothetical protein
MRNTKAFLSVAELAEAWGKHKATIIRRIASGDIPAINVAPKGSPVKRWRIPASELQRPGMVSVPIEKPKRVRKPKNK